MKNKILTTVKAIFVFSATVSQAALVEDYQSAQQADYQPIDAQPVENKDWSITIGAGAFIAPKYEGADEHKIRPLPFFDVCYKDKLSLGPLGGLRFNLIHYGNFTAGIGISVNFGRDEKDSNHLKGLGNIDETAEALIFASHKYNKISINITLAQDAIGEGHRGFTAKASVGYVEKKAHYA